MWLYVMQVRDPKVSDGCVLYRQICLSVPISKPGINDDCNLRQCSLQHGDQRYNRLIHERCSLGEDATGTRSAISVRPHSEGRSVRESRGVVVSVLQTRSSRMLVFRLHLCSYLNNNTNNSKS